MGHQEMTMSQKRSTGKQLVLEGLQICPSSIKNTSEKNTSGNMSDEWSEVNYVEELWKD